MAKTATATAATAPLFENPDFKALLKILAENDAPGLQGYMALMGQVSVMQGQLNNAMAELAAMRQELHALHMGQQPAQEAQKAVGVLEKSVATLRERLNTLKQDIISGCKSAVAAFKEKGVSALDNLADFFHIRGGLSAVRDALDSTIEADNAAIAKIEAASKEYHQAGLHLKNAARAVVGKEAATQAKPVGKLAHGMEAPFKAERATFAKMRQGVEKAIGGLDKLEQAAQAPARPEPEQAAREPSGPEQGKAVRVKVRPKPDKAKGREPSMLETLDQLNAKIAAEATAPKRAAPEAAHDGR